MLRHVPSRFTGRSPLSTVLERLLAEESRLAAVTRTYAWRVRGAPMASLNRLFAEQGRQIDQWMSDLADRAGDFGVALRRRPAAAGARARPAGISELVAGHEAIASELRETVRDLDAREPDGDAAFLLRGLLEFHETTLWMLRRLAGGRGAN